ncbi:uncharacterized protein BXZ73DRAFT_21959, partial [Epithele typhae]|uniref:uncharacterized protein n=1 Tax=Epithele typhae TaxID=378194 RepID=UPI00200800A3
FFIGLLVVFAVFQSRVEAAIRPAARFLRDLPFGWLIPIGVLFVLSFPPLFGAELIHIIVGDVWGFLPGIAIVSAGTLLGELANYYTFRWWCMARGRKLEERRISYALYAQVVREGGLVAAIIMRYSAIPSHFTTALFASCGMTVWTFLASAIVSLPKQFAGVFLGSSGTSGTSSKVTTTVKGVVVLITIVATIFAMKYINRRVDEVKEGVIYMRRKQR